MKLKQIQQIFLALGLSLILTGCGSEVKEEDDLQNTSWTEIEKKATGTTVNFMMWQGSPAINNYINNYVIPAVKEKHNINLEISGGQGPEIVQLVMGEKEAGVTQSQVDMVWINGETFFQLRKIEGLWGPFVEQLPNAEYIDFSDPFIHTDFQQPVNYMEAPWSIGQFAMVCDSTKVQDPPANMEALETYVKNSPGTFTISNDFTGMTLLKSFLAEIGGGPNSLDGEFDEEKYLKLSSQLWEYINNNKQYFWKEGETFPKEQSKMSQLFASGELAITCGFSEGGIEEKVKTGLYPKSTIAYAWENGTIKNTNYLGILDNASNKAGAMQVINFLLSPEAQFRKANADGMDANTVLEIDRLPEEWKQKFENAPGRQYGMEMEELENFAIQEPAPEYMIRLYEDFRTEVIEK